MPEQYKGGFVYEPKAGIYKKIIVLDFRSLYPSIIVTHNIDNSTLNCSHQECKKNKVPGFDRWFCTKIEGKIPEKVKEMIHDREVVKKQLKNKKLSPEDRLKLEKREKQLKLATNIQYGMFGYTKSPTYNVKIAESISAFGRYYIQSVIKKAQEEGFEVIYADTDSLFFKGNVKKAKKFLDKINKWLPGIIKLEWKGLYEKGLFVAKKSGEGAKKKYALLDSKGNLLVKGFETVRGDWCILAKKTQENILKLILSDKKNEAIRYVRTIVEKLKNNEVPVSDLIISEQLTQPLEKYKATGPHIEVAKKMKAKGEKVEPGTMINFIITNKPGSISEKAEPAKGITINQIDKDYYINHQILPAASRVLGISEKEILNEGLKKYIK